MDSTTDFVHPVTTEPVVAIATTDSAARRVTLAFWAIAILLGVLQAWEYRHFMHSDGLAYLEIADSYIHGNWTEAINLHWSPLYSWLLGLSLIIVKPNPYWEAPIVHVVNVLIFIFTLGCFHFFLREMKLIFSETASRSENTYQILPEWSFLAIGYTVFLWSSLDLITVSNVSPDLLVAAIVYAVFGVILRIRKKKTEWPIFAVFGLLLGLGYLAKAVMFPLAFVFLGVALFSTGNLRLAVPRVLIAFVFFLLLAIPFIALLSVTKGSITYGDTGTWNYARFVNDVTSPVHWQGEPFGSGTPRHPTRKLLGAPAIYEFAYPFKVTYPPWHDPSYWYDGVVLHFELGEQTRVLIKNTKIYLQMLLGGDKRGPLGSALLIGLFVFFFVGGDWRLIFRTMFKLWCLLVPVVAAFMMYALVHVEPRHIAPFFTTLYVTLFSSASMKESTEINRLIKAITIAIVAMFITPVGYSTVRNQLPALINGELDAGWQWQWEAANELKRMGVSRGSEAAFIGESMRFYWARLAGIRMVAEIRQGVASGRGVSTVNPHVLRGPQSVDIFWSKDPTGRVKAMETFKKLGIEIVVADKVPDWASRSGWRRIGNTTFHVHFLTDHRSKHSGQTDENFSKKGT